MSRFERPSAVRRSRPDAHIAPAEARMCLALHAAARAHRLGECRARAHRRTSCGMPPSTRRSNLSGTSSLQRHPRRGGSARPRSTASSECSRAALTPAEVARRAGSGCAACRGGRSTCPDDLDDARHHVGHRWGRSDEASLGCALGRCGQHRRRLGRDLPRVRLRRRAHLWICFRLTEPPSASGSAVVGIAVRSDATTGRSPAAPCPVGSAPPCAAGDWLSWLSRICRRCSPPSPAPRGC